MGRAFESFGLAERGTLRQLGEGTIYASVGTAIFQVCTVLVGIGIARILTVEDFGIFALLMSTVTTASVVAGAGLATTATRNIAAARTSDPASVGRTIAFVVVTGGSVLLAAPPLSYALSSMIAPDAGSVGTVRFSVALGGWLLLVNTASILQQGILTGFQDFKGICIFLTLRGGALVALGLVGTVGWGLPGAILGSTLGGLIPLCWAAHRSGMHLRAMGVAVSWFEWRREGHLWKSFTAPALLSGALVSMVNWLTSVFVSRSSNGMQEVGLLNVALQWRSVLLFLPTLLGSVSLPYMSRKRDARVMSDVLRTSTLLVGAVSIPLVVAVTLLAPHVLSLYGPAFLGRSTVVLYLSVSAFVMAMTIPAGNAFAAENRMWIGVMLNCGWAIVHGLFLLMFSASGRAADGAALAFLLSYLVHGVATLLVARLLLKANGARSERVF